MRYQLRGWSLQTRLTSEVAFLPQAVLRRKALQRFRQRSTICCPADLVRSLEGSSEISLRVTLHPYHARAYVTGARTPLNSSRA